MDYTKLLKLQKDIKPIIKDSSNPFFKSKYADINSVLAELRPLLTQNGLVIAQPLKTLESGIQLVTTLLIDAESGNVLLESSLALPQITDSQKMGAAITYFRRYALVSMFCLEQEDDDGNSANINKPMQESKDPSKQKIDPNLGQGVIQPNLLPATLCGSPRRYQAAGISKAGKAYGAFYPCSHGKDEQTNDCKKSVIWEDQAADILAQSQGFDDAFHG